MYFLLIFALPFTLSRKMKDDDRMLERIMKAMGEEGLAQLMNSLDEGRLDILMDCIEMECKDEEFVSIKKEGTGNILSYFDEGAGGIALPAKSTPTYTVVKQKIMPKVLEIIKGINGGKAGCLLVKTFIKVGAMYDLITNVSEKVMIKIINDLPAKHLEILICMHKVKVKATDLANLGKKLLPIIKPIKRLTKLKETLINADQEVQNILNSRRNSNQKGRNGGTRSSGGRKNSRRESSNQGSTNAAGGAPMQGTNGADGGGAATSGK